MTRITQSSSTNAVPGSFRDPSGFLFFRNHTLYRQINEGYRQHYDTLMNSGLYRELTENHLLIPHREAEPTERVQAAPGAYTVIAPKIVPFISYPYEWSFSQLKNAALTTLEIQKRSLNHGMSLKDSSAYNIQFLKNKPVLIDTLSFEQYREGQPWIAYRQFCQHFLAPLVLMSYRDIRLSQLLRIYIDGIPLDLASELLPSRTRFKFSLLSHIHLHAKSQKRYESSSINTSRRTVSRLALTALIANLEASIRRLRWKPAGTEWADYYEDTNYSHEAFDFKKKIVADFIHTCKPKTVWDMGANTGEFSYAVSERGIPCIAFDIDPAAVEKNYLHCLKANATDVLPLVLDLTNPSPSIGWANRERMSLFERGPADAALALALVHHLAISNNVPLANIADFFASICEWLLIEFIPKNDSQVKRLLVSREDIFHLYTQQEFERVFSKQFTIITSVPVKHSDRILYTMRRSSATAL
ncbi:MAG: SAM-dependent methyltransferase [Parcubacteria group bacterium]